MKRIVTIVTLLVFMKALCVAQSGIISIRAGGGLIVDEPKPGIACTMDFKTGKLPFIVTPFLQYFFLDGFEKLYYGANIQVAKNLSKGLYLGFGGGFSSWSHERKTRTSPSIAPIVGVRVRMMENLSFFSEAKFYYNTKMNQSNSDWIEGVYPLFTNDIAVVFGLSYLLF